MELRHLRYFVMVGETLNLSRASEKLHVSQPALSRQIRDLEEEIGTPLFVRHTSGVELTAAGRLFLNRSSEILNKATSAIREVDGARQTSERVLRLAFDPGAIYEGFFQALARFGREAPDIALMLEEGDRGELLRKLRDKTTDIAFITGSPDPLPADIAYRIISKRPLSVCVGLNHRLAESTEDVSLEELKDERLIILNYPLLPYWRQKVIQSFRRAGVEPARVTYAPNHSALLGLVAAGQGIALFPAGGWGYEHCVSVCGIPLREPLQWSIGAAWSRHSPHPLRDAFLADFTDKASRFAKSQVAGQAAVHLQSVP